MKRKHILLQALGLSLVLTISSSCQTPKPINNFSTSNNKTSVSSLSSNDISPNIEKLAVIDSSNTSKQAKNRTSITLSFIGDCTLGTDDNCSYNNSFNYFFNKNGYSYFFDGVSKIIDNDDLTIANLETTLTTSNNINKKAFNFKGNPSYVKILTEGSVEVVNIANNHIRDYYEKGYNDTINNLNNAKVDYYGMNYKQNNSVLLIKEVKGIKIGFLGLIGSKANKSIIDKAMKYFNDNGVNIKIVTFHWGQEYHYEFNSSQASLGRYCIDKGADLVVGHHPHILEGIEKYKGHYIVYSLGNFVFGGNKNPIDKDSMIFQQTFIYENNKLISAPINIIPVSISTKSYMNDYQPYILEGTAKTKVINKINKYSYNFHYDEKK